MVKLMFIAYFKVIYKVVNSYNRNGFTLKLEVFKGNAKISERQG